VTAGVRRCTFEICVVGDVDVWPPIPNRLLDHPGDHLEAWFEFGQGHAAVGLGVDDVFADDFHRQPIAAAETHIGPLGF